MGEILLADRMTSAPVAPHRRGFVVAPATSFSEQLRQAVVGNELDVEYQPQWDLRTGRCVGVEALARWGDIPPEIFIRFAERDNLINSIGRQILVRVLRQMLQWDKIHLRVPYVAINLSPHELADRRFHEAVAHACESADVAPYRIRFEIAEMAVSSLSHDDLRTLRQLRRTGCGLAIADFGKTEVNPARLRYVPVQAVKIDQSIVQSCTYSRQSRCSLEGIIGMAESLDLDTIAVGVETSAQAGLLRDFGCGAAQGYHFARPTRGDHLRVT